MRGPDKRKLQHAKPLLIKRLPKLRRLLPLLRRNRERLKRRMPKNLG